MTARAGCSPTNADLAQPVLKPGVRDDPTLAVIVEDVLVSGNERLGHCARRLALESVMKDAAR